MSHTRFGAAICGAAMISSPCCAYSVGFLANNPDLSAWRAFGPVGVACMWIAACFEERELSVRAHDFLSTISGRDLGRSAVSHSHACFRRVSDLIDRACCAGCDDGGGAAD
eukprot:3284076-Pleurochrysis_carterae.AAC.2